MQAGRWQLQLPALHVPTDLDRVAALNTQFDHIVDAQLSKLQGRQDAGVPQPADCGDADAVF